MRRIVTFAVMVLVMAATCWAEQAVNIGPSATQKLTWDNKYDSDNFVKGTAYPDVNSSSIPYGHNYYGKDQIVMMDTNDTTYPWTCTYGVGAADSTYVKTAESSSQIESVKFTPDGSHNLMICALDHGSAVNATGKILELLIYIHPGTGSANPDGPNGINSIEVYPYNTTVGNRFVMTTYTSAPVYDTRAGWQRIVIPMEVNDIYGWQSTGTPDINNIRTLGLTFVFKSVSTVAVTIDRWAIYSSPFTTGAYTIRIDTPISTNVKKIAAYAKAKGVRLCIGIAPDYIGDAGNLTVADLKALAADGHEIDFYTLTDADENTWVNKTQTQKIAACRNWRNFIATNNIPQGKGIVLFQRGGSGWCPWDQETLKPAFIAVSGGSTLWPTQKLLCSALPSDVHHWSTFLLDAATPTWYFDRLISDANSMKLILAVGAHCATENERTALFTAINSLTASSLKNVTWRDVVEGKLE